MAFWTGLISFFLILAKAKSPSRGRPHGALAFAYPPPGAEPSPTATVFSLRPSSSPPPSYSSTPTPEMPIVNSTYFWYLPLAVTPCYESDGRHATGYTVPIGSFYGGQMRFAEVSYDQPYGVHLGAFILGGMWNHFSSGNAMEIGYSRGWQGLDIYVFYAAWVVDGGYEEVELSTVPSGPGTMHTYDIYRSRYDNTPPYDWVLALDGIADVIFLPLHETVSMQLAVGGEISGTGSKMNVTEFENFIYYLSRGKFGPVDWQLNTTLCSDGLPMKWAWITFPVSGKAWTP